MNIFAELKKQGKSILQPKALFWTVFTSFFVSHLWAGPFQYLIEPEKATLPQFTQDDLLEESQISYRAEGGFTGVESYGVIISCVKGRVSVMSSIYDPRLEGDNSRTRQLGSMDAADYLLLWTDLEKQAFFKMHDSTPVTMDIRDEFTNHFYAKIGKNHHQFQVVGISRPEASRYFSLRERIDQSVNMKNLWDTHTQLARYLEEPSLTKNVE